MYKRRIVMILLSFVLFLPVNKVFAWEDMGPYTYWYSDENRIGHFVGPIAVRSISSGAGLGSNVVVYGNAARSAWSGLVSTTATSGSDYKILVTDILRSDIDGYAPVHAVAVTFSYSLSQEGMASVGGSTSKKKVYTMGSSAIFLIVDSYTEAFSTAKWCSIAAHEMGHALGYFGHDLNAGSTDKSIMNPVVDIYWDSWGVSSPTIRDLRHLGNVY